MSSYLEQIPDYSLYAYPASSSRTSALQHLRAHQSEPNPLLGLHTLDPQKIEKHRRASSMAEMQSQQVMDSTAGGYAGEKRRNKLGYHRTAMACSHCRRRKIRCLMQLGDPEKRCINCIKLKRECHFQPVDNQVGDRRSRANSKSDFMGDISPGSSPVQGHSMGNLDAQLEGYSNGSMMHGFDPNSAVYGDGLSRAATWTGGDYMDHGALSAADGLSMDPYGSSYSGEPVTMEPDGIATGSRRQSSNWASHTPPLTSYHSTNGIAYASAQPGVEDLVSLPGSSHGVAQNWQTAYHNHPGMYSRNQVAYSSGYQDPAQHHYDSPAIQSTYHTR